MSRCFNGSFGRVEIRFLQENCLLTAELSARWLMAAVLTVWSVPQEAPMKCSVSQRDVGGELAACVRVSF